MTKKLLLAAATMTLIMSGCAQKTIATDADAAGANSADSMAQNVDPYGSNMDTNGAAYDASNTYQGGGVENIYFGVNQYTITSDNLSTIANNANLLKNDKIKIEGHCDAAGSDEFNYALGLKRAHAAKDALVMKGINAGSISLVSMGESSPECTTSTSDDCYSKNRRVEFKAVQ